MPDRPCIQAHYHIPQDDVTEDVPVSGPHACCMPRAAMMDLKHQHTLGTGGSEYLQDRREEPVS
jgi:hypothetical protein